MNVVTSLELPLKKFKSGKVREMYEVDNNLLMVATDRISAFDSVLPNGIPHKGQVLNQISLFWFNMFKGDVENHVLVSDFSEYPEELKQHAELEKRSAIVKRSEPLVIECIVRGYLAGSGWKEYKENGTVCGIELPEGLQESSKLPEPIFTPSTKAENGHDINISFEKATEAIGQENAEFVRDKSIALYKKASEYALEKGIIIADTKFEFGILDGNIILIDEVLTPDSSRFWPSDSYEEGKSQKSFDKQYVRDYLLSINWNKEPPAPELPSDVIENTSNKYIEAYERLTGENL